MAIELKVPSAGESITEVVVAEWLKPEGAQADRDEPVALIETDKANVELVAPVKGTLAKILKKAGDSARVGEVIALLEPADAAAAKPVSGKLEAVGGKKAEKVEIAGANPENPPVAAPAPKPAAAEQPKPAAAVEAESEERATPSKRRAKREAEHRGEAAPKGNGPAPRPTQDPAPRASSLQGDQAEAQGAAPQARGEPPRLRGREADRREEVVAMSPLRRRVAERLVEAQQTAAMLTTFNEVDLTQVITLRKDHQEAFKTKHGVKLGFMSFFVKAAIEGLRAFPAINAEIRGTDIVYHHYFDIGVAVGGGKGLVVPVIRNAERMSFAEIEKTIGDFGERAKTGRLKVEELQGGTFTISNGGVYGSMMSTPILNPPQSGILGMHAIQERPVARNGAVAIASMMYVALTYDHRIVDGREAVSFLIRVKECVENPTRLLLEV